ncbi:MAG: hypothetical protein GC181_08335 [Bacteroidetes bacterium]|nr:hypothetical protein [Bacteroidota bacterium]
MKLSFRKLSAIALISLSFSSPAQQFDHYLHDADATPRDHQLDVSHMLVNVSFEPLAGIVNGTVTHTFKPIRQTVDTVFWDAPSITIKEVKLQVDGKEAEVTFKTNDDGVITYFKKPLNWNQECKLTFNYTAKPKKGIYFIGWNVKVTDTRNQTRHQIWTQGQGIDNRHWIPMYDNMNDKFITETIITFDKAYNVLSNGDLVEKTEKNDLATWHYKMRHPHAGYLLMIAIDQFGIKKTTTSRGTPVEFWYYPEHPEKVEPTSIYTEKMIEFLEDETGFPYPWGKYSQVMVQDFIYGAMENTSATIFGDFFNVDEYSFNDRNYIGVNCHELTHQWFGDLVTARSGAGTWLQESFATYYAKLFMKQLYGDDEYRWNMRGEVKSALAASEKDLYPIVHTHAGTARVYPKGSSVLHMLRYVLGDEEFKRVIKYYLEKHAYGNVETNDLKQAIEDVLGRPMDWFFDEWLYRGGEPHFKINHAINGNRLTMTVLQTQLMDLTIHPFKMPVNIGIYFTDGTKQEKMVWIDEEKEVIAFDIPSGKTLSYTLFDVNSEIIKSVDYEKPLDMLLRQFQSAEHMIDRYDALMAMEKTEISKKREALLKALKTEKFYGLRGEIVKQLTNDKDAADALVKILKNDDVRVRRILLNNTDDVAMYKYVFVSALEDKSYQNIEVALSKLIEQDGANANRYLQMTSGITGLNHNVRITWLGYKILQLRKDSSSLMRDKNSSYYTYMNELTLYTSGTYEFRTRINAMNAVKKFNFLSAPAIENMFDACLSKNGRLAAPAKDILLWYKDQYELAVAIQKVFESLNYTEDQKKTLRDMGVVR